MWLELILDFLEADWDSRMKQIKKEEDVDQEQLLLDSLLWHYITSEGPTSRTNRTRMIRAILAMATSDSNKEFREIWKGETLDREPKQENHTRPIAKADSSNDEWKDQNSDDEDVVMENAEDEAPVMFPSRSPSTSSLSSSFKSISEPEEPLDLLGGMDALNLRQRFLALVCIVSPLWRTHIDIMQSFAKWHTVFLPTLPILEASMILLSPTCSSTSPLPSSASSSRLQSYRTYFKQP